MDSFLRKIKPNFSLLMSLFILISIACNRGSGCPSEDAQVKTDKKGMPTKKSQSGLFDKKTSKKMHLTK